jgi:hypothetical protein
MTDETNDMIPTDPEKKLPASLDRHLRTILPDKDLNHFREQLPPAFLSDATEGLDHLRDTKHLETVLQQLNQQMHQQLKNKKKHKFRRSAGDMRWSYWAIIIILLLCIGSFIVIRLLLRH